MLTRSSERLARRPGVMADGNRPVASLKPGDLVNHDSYGLGRALSVEGRGDDPEAKVDFGEEYGIKHLLIRYARSEKNLTQPAHDAKSVVLPGDWRPLGSIRRSR